MSRIGLPTSHGGWLPYWLLFMTVLPAVNTIGNYASGSEPWSNAVLLYPNATFTALQGRTFGTWTLITTAVRLYAAYDIRQKALYELAMFTLFAANMHFVLEWLWFGTMTTKAFTQSAGIDLPSFAWMVVGWTRGWYFS